ncbi:MAG: GDSL family lipase [Butyrivibrio sp.]|nr:GDSL family lipase [Butyrivibrio sp.]
MRIDNRAFAGRSTKSYLAEGRMEDLLADFQEGDLLLMQFGHNDANQEKEERYVTPAQFQDKLLEGFIRPVRARGGRPVLVTPLAMRVFDEQGICPPSFQEYREAMMALGAAEDVPVIDLGRMSADFNTRIGAEACKSLYLWVPAGIWPDRPEGSTDDAHIQYTGAHIYAGLVAKELRSLGFLCDRRTV